TLRGYVNVGGGAGYDPAFDREVFTLTVNGSGGYTFTLKDQIDHPSLDGVSGGNTENLLASGLHLSSHVLARDGEGAKIALVSRKLTVQVRDDNRVVKKDVSISIQVDEDDMAAADGHLPTANSDGTGVVDEATFNNTQLQSLVNGGVDQP